MRTIDFRISAAGDSALIVEWPPRLDLATSTRVIAVANAARRRFGSTIRDAVVGYHTLTVYFDPLTLDAAWLAEQLGNLAGEPAGEGDAPGATIEVPVCYGGELGPDLSAVAEQAGCSEDEVVRLHTSLDYRVFVVGFVPGFAYMGPVDPRLALPRRSTPRTRVPAGSVAIAAGQTGIYPIETPGGWHLLGRTAVRPFDEHRAEPVLFRPGDRVTFRSVTRDEFDAAAG
ncbi:MAG TPA: 5-oxoprolinase subunit PxpB [Vicinamibacterales bacterium]|nr:5-oxoprolinase subunit PxpB [Vicinamibacterales bacterium]